MADQRPNFSQPLRGTGLSDPAVRAIEQLQRGLTDIFAGEAFRNYGRQIIGQGIGGSTGGGGAGNGVGLPIDTEIPDYSPPPPPRNLVANAGFQSILLRWEPDSDRRIGYTEILRAEVDNPGVAVVIGTASGNIYPDTGDLSRVYYYWARNVNKWNSAVRSPLNSTVGTRAETAGDIDAIMEALTGDGPDRPFYEVVSDTVINGVNIPAGVYIKSAYIRDAIVRTFRAGLAVIDSASIVSLTADKIEANSLVARIGSFTTAQIQTMFAGKAFITAANIGNAAIGSAQIADELRSANFNGNATYAGTTGWGIYKNGAVYINNLTARGNITGSTINGSTIIGSTVTASNITGTTISASTFIATLMRNSDSSAVVDMSGGAIAIRFGSSLMSYGTYGWHYPIEITTSGRAYFGDAVIAARTAVASGEFEIAAENRPTWPGLSSTKLNPWQIPVVPDPYVGGGA